MKNKACCGLVSLMFLALMITGCTSTEKMTAEDAVRPPPPSLNVIAVAPTGLLAEAVGSELFQKGYQIIPAAQVSTMIQQAFPGETYLLSPRVLSFLRSKGVQSVLLVTSRSSYGQVPSDAVVQIISTFDGSTLAATNFHYERDVFDWDKSGDVASAAHEIASSLAL